LLANKQLISMMYSHPKLAVSWLPLSILLSLNSIDFLPVNAQAVDRTQLPNSNSTQALPQPQDIQPPAPAPLPPPQ